MVTGRTLSGRYLVREELAAGGMGKVFVAHDERLGRDVALKVLRSDLAHDPVFVTRFEREARAAAALAHPNVAAVYDYGHDDVHYIVMELVRGRDLAQVLAAEGPLDPRRAATIAAQAGDALGHAHAAGMIHRDVKPANVIVGPDDHIKVTDFGIARAATDSTLTSTGSLIGTASYISPEQAAGRPATAASDVYCLGIVMFEMLTGRVPFPGDSPIAVATKHMSEDVPRASSVGPSVPPELDEWVAKATAKDPAQRFPDGAAAAAALRGGTQTSAQTAVLGAAGRTTPLTAPGGVWPIPGDRWDAERLGRRVLAGALIALLLGAALWMIWFASGDDEPETSRRQRERGTASQAAERGTIPQDIVGRPVEDVQKELADGGFTSVVQEAVTDSDQELYTVDSSDPEPGSTDVPLSDTITLYVSFPPDEEDEDDEEDEPGPPEDKATKGKAKGHEKDD